jgi:formylglycine-generating enzyme required for sulfatase activity
MHPIIRLVLALVVSLGWLALPSAAQQCCTGNVTTYCTAGTSVQGCVPQISGQGVPDTAAGSGFDIVVGQMPGQRMGLIFYGATAIPQPQPWSLGSTSYLCIFYPVARTGAKNSGGTANTCSGELRVDFNAFMAGNPSALGSPFASGQQFHAQGWYRDPSAAKATNLSDALSFTLCTSAVDTTPPIISVCAASRTLSADANCQATVPDLTVGVVATDNCSSVLLTQSPVAYTSFLPLGIHVVTVTACDAAGNLSHCIVTLTVADDTPPLITTCATSQTIAAAGNCQAIMPDFTAGVSALDFCGGVVSVSQYPPAGARVLLSSSTVTLTAMDVCGNTSVCTATLTVMFTGPCLTSSGFVAIPAGSFQMGELGVEGPVHTVTISYPYWMSASEVTQAQYSFLMNSNPSSFQGSPNRPVENVTWQRARGYCAALTAQQAALGGVPAGYEYRLPTEAEWEYACRAGTTSSWSVGNSLMCSKANFRGGANNGYCVGSTSVVGSYAPNAWGLYDMHGNVWEWCLDAYLPYSAAVAVDPFVAVGSGRTIRGGSWRDYSSGCRSAIRGYTDSASTFHYVGFRVVLGPILVP